ncbi:MAG: gamma-glutamyltransferase family protein [Sphaerochaetaceae bacterium]|nr:gamma-glutamyltransferase family protein [Sphaerochaetaceae bacterium]
MQRFFDLFSNPHPVGRICAVARRGMVGASQPTAAQAGISMLERGGNAIDAAIATAAALTVVEPTSNGIGGDAFALVWTNGALHGLNASGPSPRSISLEAVLERKFTRMPRFGWEPVTVPGVPAAWAELSRRFGRLPLAETLNPAIRLARDGYAVPPNLSKLWQAAFTEYRRELQGAQFEPWFTTFAPNGRAPRVGESWNSPDHAKTLELIAASDAKAFYEGELAERIDAFSSSGGGFLSKDDLASYKPEWVQPISTGYRGFDVWEIPPNGQGMSVLMALNILKQLECDDHHSGLSVHQAIEAVKLAMADSSMHVTDPSVMRVPVERLLSDAYAAERASLIGPEALLPHPGEPVKGGTVYLATADDEGNMVSYIQSNYEGFGSALVVPGTGIALQDRGCNFSLDPNHVNCLGPNKRTFHTIIPGFLTAEGIPVGPFGVMGGFNQPQGHVQVLTNMIDRHLNPQAALDAPRWRWLTEKEVLVEPHFSRSVADALMRRGHEVSTSMDAGMFGRGQIICKDPQTGALIGGTESRTDGMIAVL